MELFNLALLGKWRWRLKADKKGEWAVLLNRLYGEGGILNSKQASVWWKYVQKIDDNNSLNQGWLEDNIKAKVGDGSSLRFWTDSRCGPYKLRDVYPNLFQIVGEKNCSIIDAESGSNSAECWKLSWTRELTPEEHLEGNLMQEMLLSFTLDSSATDCWLWPKDTSKSYTVKSTYLYLLSCSNEAEIDEIKTAALKRLWKAAAPSKFQVLRGDY